MPAQWYAMKSKPNKEDFLANQLDGRGVGVFYPRLVVKPVNPRSRKIQPYFPGYLFVQADFEVVNLSDLQWLPGAVGLVSFGGEPAVVPESLVGALQKQIDEMNAITKAQAGNFQVGETVVVHSGPFAGYEAIFDGRISGQDRVRVLLNFLQRRQIPLELKSQDIGRAKRS